jgi:hypothetical protein
MCDESIAQANRNLTGAFFSESRRDQLVVVRAVASILHLTKNLWHGPL